MNPTELILRVGDSAPALPWQLLDRLGDAVNLSTGDPSVRFFLVPAEGGDPVLGPIDCAIVTAAQGQVRLDWPAAAAALTPGSYLGQFLVRQSSTETTYPYGSSLVVRVEARLAAQEERLDVWPQDLTLAVGDTASASLQAYRTVGTAAPEWVTDQVEWSAPVNPPLVSVNALGDVVGLAAGTTIVTAKLGALSATAPVVVT